MRRGLAIGLLAGALVGLMPVAVAAAPAGGVATVGCDNGDTFDINFGAGPNQGSAGFVVGINSIFVAKQFEIRVGGEVVFGWDRGIKGFSDVTLLTCSTAGDGAVFTFVGYVAPRG